MMKTRWICALTVVSLLVMPVTAFADGGDQGLAIGGAGDLTTTETPTLKAEGGQGDTGYQWYRNDQELSEQNGKTVTADRSGDYYVVQDGKQSDSVRIAREFSSGGSSSLFIGRRSNNLAKRKDSQIQKLEAKVAQSVLDAEKPSATVTLGSIYSGIDRAVSNGGAVTIEDAGLLEENARSVLMRRIAEQKLPDRLYADTVKERNVITRLSLIPSMISAPVDLGLTFADETVIELLKKSFSNEILVLDAAQQGSYGQTVEMMVKAESLSGTGNLCFYRFDPDTNLCSPVSVSKVSIDARDYLHFSTTSGGIYVISQGQLVK